MLIRDLSRYYQPNPSAPTPFAVVPSLHDPDFASSCAGTSGNCADAWGLRIINSNNILVYGAGLYSFFNNYNTSRNCPSYTLPLLFHSRGSPATIHSHTNERPVACSNGGGPENCQSNILSLEGGLSNINLYCLSTVGSTNMITENGKTLASYSDNVNVFPDTIALFQTGVVTPPSGGSSLIGWNFRGCYTDQVSARTLGNTMSVPGGPSAMSVEACLAVCQAAGYSLAGVEYSAECCKFTAPLECFKKEISDI
jgi:glucan 1,3-beta-glucosidase